MTYGSFPAGMMWPNEWPGQVPSRGSVTRRSPARDMSDAEWRRLVQDSLNVDNEIRFRQRVSEHLTTFGMSKRAQRAKLREAVAIFREHRKGNQVLILETGMRAPHTENKVDRTSRHTIESVRQVIKAQPVKAQPENSTPSAEPSAAETRKYPATAKPLADKDKDHPDKKLGQQIYVRVLAAGHAGLSPTKLHDLVVQYGSGAVTRAIQSSPRIVLDHGHLWVKDRTELPTHDEHPHIGHYHDIAKAAGEESSLPEQLPVGANSTKPGMGTHNVTIGVSDKALPVGARKIWNRRVVEKKDDMRWHVVGHVAGLEDPSRVPQLDEGAIDRETLLHLLQQLLRIRQAHRSAQESKDVPQ